MNRRTLLSLVPAALLTALVPWKARATSRTKYYLEYNKPYDRSLVKVTQVFGNIQGRLFWERVPGEAPCCITVMYRVGDSNLEQLHHMMQLSLKKDRTKGINSDILSYDPTTGSLANWTQQRARGPWVSQGSRA